jgi:multicomponent Na+:H+ antiporter subunit D
MLSWFVIVPVLTAIIFYIFPFEKIGKIIAIIIQILLFCCSFYVFMLCKEADVITVIGNYKSVLGITLKADTLSSVFIMLVAFIFLCVFIYNFSDNSIRRLGLLLFIWEGLLIGIFLTRDLFNVFVLVEVATVVVSILIMFIRDKRSMYDGIVYLIVNTVAIQFYLFGVGYIYKLTGVLDMDSVAQAIKEIDKKSLILPYALIITSVSLKCALMPLFSWLPKAHGTPGAPSVVSAILSGLHIKSGIYLFIRFHSIFQDIAVHDFFLITGIITGIAGFLMALSQSDIKLILAYHTISQIGMIMIGLNIPDVYTYTGAVYHIINHAFFKSALFLSAGIISNIYGTRDVYKIRGVLKRFPLVGAATIMAVFGITGVPLFNGSISKYFIMSGTNLVLTGIMMFINLGTIISFIKYSSILFGRYKPENGQDLQCDVKISGCQQFAVLLLGSFCLIGGIFGEQFIKFLFNISVSVDAAGYFQKIIFFAVSVIISLLIYKFFVKNSAFFKRIRGIELGFRGICISLGLFFALILVVVRVFGV